MRPLPPGWRRSKTTAKPLGSSSWDDATGPLSPSMPGTPLPAAGLYDANRALLRALLARLDAQVSDLGILRDDREKLSARLVEAAEGQDLVLTSGGVSTGEADYVKDAIGAAGSLVFWRVAIKPGRPVAMGVLREVNGARPKFGQRYCAWGCFRVFCSRS